ncbi:MAG: TetR family transcriptional regulator [Myxococcales bacterium]|nr:TetR family transcriptional regulator [Myxococcales bacterium]
MGQVNDRSEATRLPEARAAKLPPDAVLEPAKRRILEIALRMFAMHGFHGTSMRDLAKAIELAPSALYASFPSKEHVLAELVRLGHEAHLAMFRKAVLDGGSDPADQLRALVHANAVMHATYPHLAVVVNDEMHVLNAELAAPGLALRRQGIAMLMDIIERGIAMKRFAARHPVVTAGAIGAMALRIPHWFGPSVGITVDELAAAQAALALDMVGVAR